MAPEVLAHSLHQRLLSWVLQLNNERSLRSVDGGASRAAHLGSWAHPQKDPEKAHHIE